MSRKITFANKELRELMQKRNKLVMEGRKEDAERQRLEESINKKGLELQKIDGKAKKIMEKKDINLIKEGKVFEQIVSMGLEGNKVAVQIEDRVEEYVKALYKQMEKPEEEKKEEK